MISDHNLQAGDKM